MRKYGKYEARPSQSRQTHKRTLIQTYLISFSCLMMCCTMLLGTTAAWFTSDTSTRQNQINIGILKANLYHGGDGIWTTVTEQTSILPKAAWAPGDLAVETMKVENAGSLAFDYRLNLIYTYEDAAAGDALVYQQDEALDREVTDAFEVWRYVGDAMSPEMPADYAEMTASSLWEKAGESLTEVIEKRMSVFSGHVDAADASDGALPAETHAFALYLKPEAAAELQGMVLEEINISLIAYQAAGESCEDTHDQLAQEILDGAAAQNSLIVWETEMDGALTPYCAKCHTYLGGG